MCGKILESWRVLRKICGLMFKERDENCPHKTGVKATFARGMKNLTTLLTTLSYFENLVCN